jgi:putative protease
VTRVYRDALDRYLTAPESWRVDPRWREELDKISHRPYDRGFLFGGRDPLIHAADSRYLRAHDFVGVVLEAEDGQGLVAGRNRFFAGETLELIGPGMRQVSFEVGPLTGPQGEILAAGQPNARIVMALPPDARSGDLLRRAVTGDG